MKRRGESRTARSRFLTWLDGYLATVAGERDPALRTALRAALRRERHPRLFRLVDGVRARLRGER